MGCNRNFGTFSFLFALVGEAVAVSSLLWWLKGGEVFSGQILCPAVVCLFCEAVTPLSATELPVSYDEFTIDKFWSSSTN